MNWRAFFSWPRFRPWHLWATFAACVLSNANLALTHPRPLFRLLGVGILTLYTTGLFLLLHRVTKELHYWFNIVVTREHAEFDALIAKILEDFTRLHGLGQEPWQDPPQH